MRAVDLFAGPGGWDVAARTLDVDPLGIEWNDAACAVRAAAGLPKVGGSAARAVLYEEQAAGRWKPPWAFERPATTIQADSRIWPPGHKQNADDVAAGRLHYEGRAGENAIRVTEQEAARLQSFPDDYPWAAAGTRSAQFQCIGNAVPPLMGAAVLKGLLGR